MYRVIEKYMNSLDIIKLNTLAIKKEIFLSEEELEFSFNFIKKNWNTILSNPKSFDITKYKNIYSEENYIKIKNLYLEFYNKYSHYL